MSFDVQSRLPPGLVLLALAVLALVCVGVALSIAAALHPPLRGRLWPRRSGPRPLPVGVAVRALVTLVLGVVAIRVWRERAPSDFGSWSLPISGTIAQGLMILCVLAAVFTPERSAGEAFERLGLSRPRGRHLLSGAAAWLCSLWLILAASMVSALVYVLVSGRALPVQGTVQLIQQAGAGPRLATALLAVLVAPVVEEVTFRGLVFRSLRLRTGFWGAALISASLFALIHLDPLHSLRLAALGLVLAWVYERTGSLWPAIFLHSVQNLVAVVTIYLSLLPAS